MTGFGVEHLPYGVIAPAGGEPRGAVRFGDGAFDLTAIDDMFAAPTLNDFLAAGPETWARVRAEVQDRIEGASLIPLDDAEVLLPIAIGDYVDFYASLHHATNLGRMFRPDGEDLTFGEMSAPAKNRLSHRMRALEALAARCLA